MDPCSPIVLNTSSPVSLRTPSPAPHSAGQKSNNKSIAESSSPTLPDASTFYTKLSGALKNGSHLQQVAEGTAAGVASAPSLWKTQKLNEIGSGKTEEHSKTKNDGEDGANAEKKLAKGPAKAVRLQKTAQKDTDAAKTKSADLQSPSMSFAFQDPAMNTHFKVSATLPQSPIVQSKRVRTQSEQTGEAPRLSVYDFPASDDVCPQALRTISEKPLKKPRKHRTNKAETKGKNTLERKPQKRAANLSQEVPTKKPKKRFTKSESIILNSDEPEAPPEATKEQPEQSATSAGRCEAVTENAALRPSVSGAAVDNSAGAVAAKNKETTVDVLSAKVTLVPEAGAVSKQTNINRATVFETTVTLSGAAEISTQATHKTKFVRQDVPREGLSCTTTGDKANLSPAKTSSSPTAASIVAEPLLPSLIKGFTYTNSSSNTNSLDRVITGDALTKRRRIDLANASIIGPLGRNVPELPPAEPAKKAKAPKKKPQTITALATKAFHPTDVEPAQPSVSTFFAPQIAQTSTCINLETMAASEKPKKSRKPRVKKFNADGAPIKTTKTPKAKKGKVHIKEANYLAPLYWPEKARGEEKAQSFLFGTSSQLTAEESPSFIWPEQLALQESEIMQFPQSTLTPGYQSRIKVVSAPHGTNLSVGQADRDLWCSAARDHEGEVFTMDSPARCKATTAAPTTTGTTFDVSESPSDNPCQGEFGLKEAGGNTAAIIEQPCLPFASSLPDVNPHLDHEKNAQERVFIDLSLTPPLFDDKEAIVLGKSPVPSNPTESASADLMFEDPLFDDSWMLLKSDESTLQEPSAAVDNASAPPHTAVYPVVQAPQLKSSSISPTRQRAALQMLDANISLAAKTSPLKLEQTQQRAMNTAASTASVSRPRGRPRKEYTVVPQESPMSKKRQGSPPRKVVVPSDIAQAKANVTASKDTTSSKWVNIDEISDSEPPNTPSPPRRRGNLSPAVQSLDLEIITSPSRTAAPAVAACTVKSGATNWPKIAQDLFPRITATVRSTPPSAELDTPTWHEKILLYDPIVLEDLTAWLNKQDVRIEVQKVKPRVKKKGRKPKDAVLEDTEYETCLEELKPWMVQKWCEENSICCLWKEGLRGGVRTRY